MGIYSTTEMTRNEAMREIATHLSQATDEQIAGVLFALIGEKWLSNFTIVPDEE